MTTPLPPAGPRDAVGGDPHASPHDVEAVLDDLSAGLVDALGPALVGLWVHGSLVAGDFELARSDLDLLAVLDAPPDEATLAAVAPMHASVEARHPGWRGRVEVETVGLPTVVSLAGGGEPTTADVIMRVSPGEHLHLLPATSHRLLTWATVRARSRSLRGPDASEVLPEVAPERVRESLLDHVRGWPEWVGGMRRAGAQSYAVLSLCRARCALVDGDQLSKRAAADRVAAYDESRHPDDAELVRWAREWWYAGGADTDTGRFEQVRDFVVRTSRDLLAAEATAT